MLPDDLPRVALAHLPTAIEELPRLGAELGGPRLFVKRDDCTGLAIGGNKTRKLEYLVADAQAQGADTLISEGGVQSNHCRQTIAAAARVGMRCVLVLNRGFSDEETGNLLLDRLLGAEVILVDDPEQRDAAMARVADELTAEGRHPYLIPTGGSNGIGAMGYARFMQELAEQERELGLHFDALVTASGSGGTQGGLILGRALFASRTEIVGISDGEPRDELAAMVLDVANQGSALLGRDLKLADADVRIHDEYYGKGYGIPSSEMVEAVQLTARTEGLLLDPVYSGKAMAGLIDLVRKGAFAADTRNLLFLHTGGTPALFAYRNSFPAS